LDKKASLRRLSKGPMKKLKILSKTHVPWMKEQKFPHPYLEVEVFDEEVMFDILKVDSTAKELESQCIFLSREDAMKLGKWLYQNSRKEV